MAGKLNAKKVEALTKPGRYADGNKLYLFISANGGKRWNRQVSMRANSSSRSMIWRRISRS